MKRFMAVLLITALAVTALVGLTGCKKEAEKVDVKFVQFFDPDCPFCQEMEPTVDKLRTKYEDQLLDFRIIDVTTDEGLDLAHEYGVFVTPTFFMTDADDNILDKIAGAATQDTMEKFIERAISEAKGESTGPAEDPEITGSTEIGADGSDSQTE